MTPDAPRLKRRLSRLGDFGAAVLLSATCLILAAALDMWAMTERLRLGWELTENLIFTPGTFVFSTVAVTLLWAIRALLGRFSIPAPKAITILTGALLYGVPARLLMAERPEITLLILLTLAGGVTGWLTCHFLARTTPQPRRYRIAPFAALLLPTAAASLLILEPWLSNLGKSQPAPSLLGPRILGGATFQSRLWLFNAEGKLASYDLDRWRPVVHAEKNVIDLKTQADSLWTLSAPPPVNADHQPPGTFKVARFRDGRWTFLPTASYGPDDRPLVLLPLPDGPAVIGTSHLHRFDGKSGAWSIRPLSDPFEMRARISAAPAGSDIAYVGVNQGEFGGGIFRLTLDDGRLHPIEPDGPVTAIVADDRQAGCVWASVGLSHFLRTGRVLHVCGTKATLALERPILPIGEKIERFFNTKARQRPIETEPFFGLQPAPGGYWAVTPRALYHARNGQVERIPFPRLRAKAGMSVSTAIPGLTVLTTDSNGAFSMSGYTPLVFAAQP